METAEFIEILKKDENYRGQIVYSKRIPPREATFGVLKQPLPKILEESLRKLGITKLYHHQVQAIDLVRQGENVIIVTGTASGKSLCYNIPVLEAILKNRRNASLYLFPTKALAQDQLRILHQFKLPGQVPATYDGDTPIDERAWIRSNANIVLTNPDMLHYGILPHHKMWANFFLNLKYVVIDEVHILRGVFGSNVANIIRRLRRVCTHYGSKPQLILSSATVANPKELAENLIGVKVEVVDRDCSPCGEKFFLFWNPPYLDQSRERRKSSNSEATYLFVQLAKNAIRNITFSKSRRTAELVFKYARDELKDRPDVLSKTSSYRAGYLAPERRAIEQRLFSGELLGVSSTNALELGIDIGTLDACVINGFPGTIASTWQQAGRAGRKQDASLALLVAQDDPLDQYYMRYPGAFFGRSHEQAIIDFENPYILSKHLLCAAYEIPLSPEDEEYFGKFFLSVVKSLAEEGELLERKSRWFWIKREFPAQSVNIRSASQDTYSVVEMESGTLLGTIDSATAFIYIHPGAIYLHQGDSYLVVELDLAEKVAFVEPIYGDYYTQPREETTLTVLSEIRRKDCGFTSVSFGKVDVTSHVIAYQKRRIFTGEILGVEELDLPPQRFKTEAFWFTIPNNVLNALKLDNLQLAGGIHAIEHASIALLPVYAMCDRWDIGGVSTPLHFHTGMPTIFIYDGFEGGIGIAATGYELCEELLKATSVSIKDCGCREGCPSCIQSPKCGNWNEPLDKQAAIKILDKLLGWREKSRGRSLEGF
ncbi:MAG: DEAD/DEAH box helicase [Actinomycetota bacterium]|nr:DEAD/DEAH box helicase [Actinomycetota bacterium]